MRVRMQVRAIERRTKAAFWYGVCLTALAFVLFAVSIVASAQTIPLDAPRYQRDLIRSWRAVWGMRAPISTAAAQIHQESLWRYDAQSWVGARGLTQFMPKTAEWIQGQYGDELGPHEPFNPVWAMRAQARYMHVLFNDLTGMDFCEQMAFTLASYNGGLGWTLKRKRLSAAPEICLGATCKINPGITAANQRQNEEYPEKILLTLEPLYAAHGWGITSCVARSS